MERKSGRVELAFQSSKDDLGRYVSSQKLSKQRIYGIRFSVML